MNGINSGLLDQIMEDCTRKGLFVNKSSISSLNSTGFMSRVYTAYTNKGKVVINIVPDPIEEQIYQCVGKKIEYVSGMCKDVDVIPEVLAEGTLTSNGYYFIQEFKAGHNLGKRSYVNGVFVDEFLVDDPSDYLAELQTIIFKIHLHTNNRFGYVSSSDEDHDSSSDTWLKFLHKNMERNLEKLEVAEKECGISYFTNKPKEQIKNELKEFLLENKIYFETDKPRLIHGDICNYSNVLINNGRVSAVVDLEWSLFGHPAWEFVFVENPPIEGYVDLALNEGIIKDSELFKKSISYHTLFWCLWGASVHAKNIEFGPALFSEFKQYYKEHIDSHV